MLHIEKRKKNMFRRVPVEWSHGEVVILSLPGGKLLFEVGKGVKLMAGVELLVVLSVTAFYLAIMSGRVRPNQLVPDAELIQGSFE